jgi:hypothetical protein
MKWRMSESGNPFAIRNRRTVHSSPLPACSLAAKSMDMLMKLYPIGAIFRDAF